MARFANSKNDDRMLERTTWFHEFVLYNFQYFIQKRKEDDDIAWFYTSGFISMAIAFNISTILFLFIGSSWLPVKIENPGYTLVGIPWLMAFIFVFFNNRFKRYARKNKANQIKQKWKIYFWIYYIITSVIYAFAMSYYSQMT